MVLELDKVILKFIQKKQCSRIPKKTGMKDNLGDLLYYIKIYYKTAVIELIQYQFRNRQTGVQ